MDTLEDVKGMFMRADAAGDTKAAQMFSDQIDHMEKQAKPGTSAKPEVKDGSQPATQSATPGMDIAKSTVAGAGIGAGIGAVASAFAPEIMQGVGAVVMGAGVLFPPIVVPSEALGMSLFNAGTALKTARLATSLASVAMAAGSAAVSGAVGGAASGAASKTAGVVAAGVGASQKTADRVELGVGLASGFTSELGKLTGYIGKSLMPSMAKTAVNMFASFSEGKSVQAAQKALVGVTKQGVPEQFAMKQLKIGMEEAEKTAVKTRDAAIQKGMQEAMQIAGKSPTEAAKHVEKITASGNKLVSDAKSQALVIQDAFGKEIANVARFEAFAKPELNKLGPARELTDIGNELRSSITKEQQQQVAVRHTDYARAHDEVSSIAKAKEEKGLFPTDLPKNKEFVANLEAKLMNTPAGVAAAKGRTTIGDPSIKAANKQLYDALTPQIVPTGKMGADGKEVMQIVKPTFESLRQTSRKLGERAYGSVDTGFSAMGQAEAKVAKKHIDEILGEHVGPQYKAMQSKYADETGELAKYSSKTGKQATAVDRMDTEAFVTDPAALPKKMFTSATTVKDAIELTGGNKAKVMSLAKDYSRHELDGMSSKQAYEFIEKNSDWMRELPGLRQELTKTADSFKAIESNLDQAGNVLKGSQKSADEAFGASMKGSQTYNKTGFDAPTMQALLKSNDKPAIEKALNQVAGTPGGKEQLVGLARNTLGTQGKKDVGQTWENLGPIMQRLIPANEYAKLAKDVSALQKAGDTKEARNAFARLAEKAILTVTNQYLNQAK